MPEITRCPECANMLRVPDTLLGKMVKCPKCSTTFQAKAMPSAASAPSEPPAPSAPERVPETPPPLPSPAASVPPPLPPEASLPTSATPPPLPAWPPPLPTPAQSEPSASPVGSEAPLPAESLDDSAPQQGDTTGGISEKRTGGKKSRPTNVEDEDEDRPRKKRPRAEEDDEDDDRPRKRRKRDDEDDEDDEDGDFYANNREYALEKVQGPANALVILIWLEVAGFIIQVLWQIFQAGAQSWINQNSARPTLEDQQAQMIGNTVGIACAIMFAFLLIVVKFIVVYRGALKMRKLESHGLSMAAAIISVIPCISGCCLAGLPIGIWALVVLNDADVKREFDR